VSDGRVVETYELRNV